MASNGIVKKIRYSLRFLPDEMYIQLNYVLRFKKLCNLKNPKTYNEKLNWLKLHDRNPDYTKMVDKYEVKEYVKELIGQEYVIPTLGVWDDFDEINFDALPEQFVLKCTHDSEGIVIVKDKNSLDINAARIILQSAMKRNFYYIGREWQYKNIKPRIIAEKYMEDHVDGELRDYKFFCFNGEPKVFFIASERASGNVKFDYYDLNFTHLDIRQKYPNAEKEIRRPVTLEKMIELSKILSKEMPHVRVDFYEVDGKVYFGELTFCHFGGFMPFKPKEWDLIWGGFLTLPQ